MSEWRDALDTATAEQVLKHLQACDASFVPRLSGRNLAARELYQSMGFNLASAPVTEWLYLQLNLIPPAGEPSP